MFESAKPSVLAIGTISLLVVYLSHNSNLKWIVETCHMEAK